jgi:hypothetical protein
VRELVLQAYAEYEDETANEAAFVSGGPFPGCRRRGGVRELPGFRLHMGRSGVMRIRSIRNQSEENGQTNEAPAPPTTISKSALTEAGSSLHWNEPGMAKQISDPPLSRGNRCASIRSSWRETSCLSSGGSRRLAGAPHTAGGTGVGFVTGSHGRTRRRHHRRKCGGPVIGLGHFHVCRRGRSTAPPRRFARTVLLTFAG